MSMGPGGESRPFLCADRQYETDTTAANLMIDVLEGVALVAIARCRYKPVCFDYSPGGEQRPPCAIREVCVVVKNNRSLREHLSITITGIRRKFNANLESHPDSHGEGQNKDRQEGRGAHFSEREKVSAT